MRPEVLPFRHASTGTWTYLVLDPDSGDAALVDPVLDYDAASGRTSFQSARLLVDAVRERGASVRWLLETHAHADHLSASHRLKAAHFPDARIAIGDGFRADGSQFDHLFDDGERFAVGGIGARVIAVPGHTSDSVAYLVGDALFTGDSLFMPDGGSARCDFPGGSARLLYRSIRKLFDGLPDDTRVFVCHDYGPGGREPACETTIGEQKRSNIHFRDNAGEDDYVRLREARDATLAMPALLIPSVQANIRAGALPEAEDNGVRYFKVPIDTL